MAKLTREDVLKLAQLARLELSEQEIEEFSQELSEILGYVEQLGEIDVKGLKPTLQVNGLQNVTRADEEIDYGYDPKELLNNLPDHKDSMIKVKRMLENA